MMGIRKGERSIVVRMHDEIRKAGRPLTAAELADRLGITSEHAASECRRQVVARNMHVAIIDYGCSRKKKFIFGAGPAPLGHVPTVIGNQKMGPIEKAIVSHQQHDSFGRYASVWDYAEGKTR